MNDILRQLASLARRWVAPWRQRRGNAAIEFAIVAPVLVLLLVGAVEIGLTIMTWFTVQEAVLAGANYASHNGWGEAAIKSAVTASSAKLTSNKVTVSPFCGCPNGSGITTSDSLKCTTAPNIATNLVCPAACSVACNISGSPLNGIMPRRYITLSAELSRPSVMKSSFGLPATVKVTMTTKLP